ncbi:hypothetical protein C5167_040083 [Papaver somniferum]|uniref:Uncharacterized protein n=1 Tax=Papaver somniferum TaxID=3469 RepID=A0A4Y7IGF4_PAPSO|nr:protein PHLOEM PROTEIN 2-LIKE A2-like [Papaver somniferum]RZC47146.1 hypothetical protein C5167_040083 [Papaver somniferum]
MVLPRMAHQRGKLQTNFIKETSTAGLQTLILYPDALNVIWGGPSSNNRYWKRTTIDGSQALELVGVYWLEVSGRLPLSELTPAKKYKLYFVIQMSQNSSGWDNYDVWFNIRIAGQRSQRQKMRFNRLTRSDWHNVPDNGLEFTVPEESNAALTFAMYDIECEELKKGLLIKEVRIQEVGQ